MMYGIMRLGLDGGAFRTVAVFLRHSLMDGELKRCHSSPFHDVIQALSCLLGLLPSSISMRRSTR